ncbi:MAG: membrane protein insertase YidC [Bacteroidetes bacterium]|nr:membrane protein insertase YidC [Bacteroidota bacterium]
MDRNTLIGFLLIFGLLVTMQLVIAPEKKKMEAAQQAKLDSLRQLEQKKADSLTTLQVLPVGNDTVRVDSQAQVAQVGQLAGQFGPFAAAAVGQEKVEVLENDVIRILFTNKGGRIREVELKQHFKVQLDSNHKEIKLPLKLLEDEKNHFEYLLPVANVPAGTVSSEQLFFQAKKEGENSIVFSANAGGASAFEQVYTIAPGSYGVKYEVRFRGLENTLKQDTPVRLQWIDYLDKLEQNHQYEVNYSTVYYKPADDDYDYCSCTSNDEVKKSGEKMKWVAHSNQFFASVLLAKDAPFSGATMTTETVGKDDADLKKVSSEISFPTDLETFAMELYVGPKDFSTLRAYGSELEDIIPFGQSIMGSANRWVIRPLFNFLMSLVGVKGIVILLLTLIVKLLLYPLTYKMLYSQAKMAALKPQLAGIREKLKDDPTQLQMETMKVYREFGVNPLGGCLPVVIQMPVWLALYRFFPASIEFRQANFLWATDLSSYDAAFWLPFEIPFYGQHVSLFTLLWVVTTIMYTYYNMQQMDMGGMGGANAQMMKWMQYLMPVFFLFFFNRFASGLTCYLVFSNVLNIAQTLITKKWIIDHDKIKLKLEANRSKPKKKGGFQARLEDAMKQQKAIAAQREQAATKKKK